MLEANKAVVGWLVDEVLNGGHLELIDELYAPELAGVAKRIGPFRPASPTSTWRSWSWSPRATRSSAGSPARPLTWEHGLATRQLGVALRESMRSPSSDSATAGLSTPGR
jgi:hypothetical protein